MQAWASISIVGGFTTTLAGVDGITVEVPGVDYDGAYAALEKRLCDSLATVRAARKAEQDER